jgi:hypothetical protein
MATTHKISRGADYAAFVRKRLTENIVSRPHHIFADYAVDPAYWSQHMPAEFPWLAALAAGFVINLLDVGCTLMFAVKPWEAELRRQGLAPRKLTPPYYVTVNFIGGLLLTFVYLQFANNLGPSAKTAFIASALLWLVTRIYGGGHVVMGQIPLKIFLLMSGGLGLGYVVAGQMVRYLIGG